MENLIIYRPTGAGHEISSVGTVQALVAPETPTAAPGATGEGVHAGVTAYVRYDTGWPDIRKGDVIGVRGHRYVLHADPVQWFDQRGHPVGMVITLDTP